MIAQGAGCSSCSGGQGTYTYSFATNSNTTGSDLNSWALKETTTLPDDGKGPDVSTNMASGIGRTDSFCRLFGDINGDEQVTAADNFQLRKALTVYNPAFDVNADGQVTAADNFQFRKDLSINYFGDGFVTTI